MVYRLKVNDAESPKLPFHVETAKIRAIQKSVPDAPLTLGGARGQSARANSQEISGLPDAWDKGETLPELSPPIP